MPRRITHQDSSKSFGLLAIRYEADAISHNEIEQHIVHLIDDQTFESTCEPTNRSSLLALSLSLSLSLY